jgi:hypothetical protein
MRAHIGVAARRVRSGKLAGSLEPGQRSGQLRHLVRLTEPLRLSREQLEEAGFSPFRERAPSCLAHPVTAVRQDRTVADHELLVEPRPFALPERSALALRPQVAIKVPGFFETGLDAADLRRPEEAS